MTETPMARIPFAASQELNIADAGRWMRFMAVVQIVGGVIGLVMLLIGLFVFALLAGNVIPFPELGPEAQGQLKEMGMDGFKALFIPMLGIGLAIGGAMVVVSIWAGSLLFRAGDAFGNVAKTDDADQDFLAQAFALLKRFFIVEAVFGLLTALQAISAIFNVQTWGA